MNLSVRVYYNTRYTRNDIPYDRTVLENAPYRDFKAIWILQDLDVSTIRVEAPFESVEDVDYCRIGDRYYWCPLVRSHNLNMSELTLEYDAMTTVGIGSMTFTAGWTTRASSVSDELFENIITEPFTPSEPLVVEMGGAIVPTNGYENDIQAVTSTVNLASITNVAKTYTDTLTGLNVTVPYVPPVYGQSQFILQVNNEQFRTNLPNTIAYNLNNQAVQLAVQDVRSLGIESCITGAYKIQKEYIRDVLITDDGTIAQVTSNDTVVNSNIPIEYTVSGYTVKNKKTFSGQFNKIVLVAISSLDQETYDIHDVYSGSNNVQIRIFADCSPDGRPYARPATYLGDTTNYWMGTVSGANWQNIPLAYSQTSGALVDAYKFSRDYPTTIATGVSNSLGNFATGNIAGGITNAIGTARGATTSIQDFNIEHTLVAPEIQFAREPSLQNYFGNNFYAYRIRLSDNDTIRFDNWLTQNGYSCNQPLTKDVFNARQYFSYVKATGIDFYTTGVNMRMIDRQRVIAQLESGVRVWKTLPDPSAMTNNPIV